MIRNPGAGPMICGVPAYEIAPNALLIVNTRRGVIVAHIGVKFRNVFPRHQPLG